MKLNNDILQRLTALIKKITSKLLVFMGIIFILQIVLSFTTLPFWMYYYLGINEGKFCGEPDYIVVLGGGGMPSESGLMRTFHAAKISEEFSNSKIIIALPGDTLCRKSSVFLMKLEIMNRGIDSTRIFFESNGTNTRMQALEIARKIPNTSKVIIVTSPDHMYRACKTFQKAGLKFACGKPAFDNAIEASLELDDELRDNSILSMMGEQKQFRYQFWNHLKYQNLVYREYFAITYYKLRGWI